MACSARGQQSCRGAATARPRRWQLNLNNLPTDTALLHRLVRDIAAAIERRDGEIERLKLIIKQSPGAQFGRRSERLDPDQLALEPEDPDGDLARAPQRNRRRTGSRSNTDS